MHLPRVDDVAAALRHLLAVGVEDQPEADAVAIARAVEQQRRLGEQRVEPAARLVLRLADVVGRKPLLELSPRPRTGSGTARTASRPSRTRRRSPPRPGASRLRSSRTRSTTSSMNGRCRSSGTSPPRSRSSAIEPAQKSPSHRAVRALPDRQRRAPVALARQRPVDVALEPLAEAPVLDVLRVPPDLARSRRASGRGRRWCGCTSSPSRSRAAASRSASSAGRRARRPGLVAAAPSPRARRRSPGCVLEHVLARRSR